MAIEKILSGIQQQALSKCNLYLSFAHNAYTWLKTLKQYLIVI